MQLHIEYFQVISLRILSGFPILEQLRVDEGSRSFVEQGVTPLFNVHYAIVEQLECRDHIDDSMLMLGMRFHRIMMVGQIG